jgi:hypothetical protein
MFMSKATPRWVFFRTRSTGDERTVEISTLTV